MIHVLLASALPLAIFFISWWRNGRRTTARALVLLALGSMASSAWAVVPDMPRLWGDLEWYVDLHHRSYCNAWWFHCAIDRRDEIDSSMLFPSLFVMAAVAVLVVAWRELWKLEREQAGAGDSGDRERRE